SLQWILNGYTLSLASLILLGGSLGDRLGRRRIYVIGVVIFTAASLVCAVSPTIEVLIFARIVQGVGAALLTPGSLAIIEASFRPGRWPARDRTRAGPDRSRARRGPIARRLARLRLLVAGRLPDQRAGRPRRRGPRPPRPRDKGYVRQGSPRRPRGDPRRHW